MAIGTGVVLLLMVILAAIALRHNPPQAPGERGIRRLLIAGGLVLPVSVIVALLAYSLRLDEAQWPSITRAEAANAFHVDIIAHRWFWEARYPGVPAGEEVPPLRSPVLPRNSIALGDTPVSGQGIDTLRTINILHVPAGVPIHVRIMASDVIHSFWVPRVAGKLDAVPGKVNQLRLMFDEPGEYAGVCAEYCGDGHTSMMFTVIAYPPEDLQAALAALPKENASSGREGALPQTGRRNEE